jgi:hypothetical protein
MPFAKSGHGSWWHRGWPQRLFWKPWKHSFYAFSVTRPVRGTATPSSMFSLKPHTKGSKRLTRFSSEYTEYSTFSVKINDLEDFRAALAISPGLGLNSNWTYSSAFEQNGVPFV